MFISRKQAQKLTSAFVAAVTASVLLFTTVFGADVLLDPSFGTGGKVLTPVGSGTDIIRAIALQPDGKIIAAGEAASSTIDFAVARYNANGSLDTGFGAGGKVTTPFGTGADQGYAVAIYPASDLVNGGKIVVAGQARMTTDDFAIARYNANGSLDSTFGTGGKVTTEFTTGASEYARAVAIQPDGKIVVAGSTKSTVSKSTYDFAVVRYNTNGTLDTTFNTTGKLAVSITTNNDYADAIVIQPDGKIIIGGKGGVAKTNSSFALLRLTSTGATDFSVTTDMANKNDEIFALALQSDNKILAAGVGGGSATTVDFALARYTTAGALDTTFNATGKVTTNLTTVTTANDYGYVVGIQSDQKILVAGYSVVSGANQFSILRYTAAGVLDTTFNSAAVAPLKPGVYATPVGTGSAITYAMTIQLNGLVVMGGSAVNGATTDFALARMYYNNKPVPANDTYSPTEDIPFTSSTSVLTNDTDADSDPMTATLVTNVTHGSLTFNANGTFNYTPAANFNGADSFAYSVSDGKSTSATNGTVTLNVAAINDAPTAADNSYTTPEDTGLTPLLVNASGGLLGNDMDVDGNPLTAVKYSDPSHGVVTLNADGSFNYDPDNNWNGTDTFTYRAYDGTDYSNVATVTINVGAVNDAPVAVADSYSILENITLNVAASGVLVNDSDPDTGDILTAVKDTSPTHGTLTFNGVGSFNYVPALNYFGPDSFTYYVSDGQLSSGVVTVSITVVQTNLPPNAVADGTYSGAEDAPLTVAASGVLSNDTDDGLPGPLTAVLYTNPSNGSVTLNTNGSFTYTPNLNFNGTDSFTYRAYDGYFYSSPATATLSLSAVNDAPVATADSFITHENINPFVDIVALNDSDPEGDSLTFNLVADIPAGQGTLTFNSDGTFDYVPVAVPVIPGYYDTSFTYNATDGNGGTSSTVTANIRVYRVNAAPVITETGPESVTMSEDGSPTAFSITLHAIDSNGDTISWSVSSPASHGTASASGTGTSTDISYTPNADYNGSDSFEVMADDGFGGLAYITVNVTINPVNDAPVASDDVYATSEGTTLNVLLPANGVLHNDTDVDNAALTAALDTSPASGILTFNSNGTFSYTPAMNFNGSVTFTYHVSDGSLPSAPATVTINVSAVNDPPVAAPDGTYTTSEGMQLSEAVPGVLGNDSDPDSPTIAAVLDTTTSHGALTLNANGSFTYDPTPTYNGGDSFIYHATDGLLDSSIVTVTINVTSVNDVPTIDQTNPVTVMMDEDDTFPTTVLTATDAENDPLTWSIASGASNGDAGIDASTGEVSYAPNPDWNGNDSFTVEVSDGNGGTDTVVVEVTVNPVNDAPVAEDNAFSVDEDNSLNITPPGLLGNDTDVENDPLTISSHTDPSNGMLTVNEDGSFIYTPDANFNGEDSFTYHVSDGKVNSATAATVVITVNPVADAPAAITDVYTVPEDTSTIIVAVSGVLANDTDADGDTMTAALNVDVTHGTLAFSSDGSFTYMPNTNFSGQDGFTYHANDGGLDSSIVTVTLNVNNSNDAPGAATDSYSVSEDDNLIAPVPGVLSNDSDADGDTMVALLDQNVSHGTLILHGDGSFTYTPNANWHGDDTFTYHVTDGLLDSVPVTVTITVNSMPDAPLANNDTYTVDEDASLTVNATDGALKNDTDADGALPPLTAEKVLNPAHGALTFNSDGSFSYMPNANFFGTDTFTYKAYDGGNYSDPAATVTINVTGVNNAPITSGISAVTVSAPDTSIDLWDSFADLEDADSAMTYSVIGNTNSALVTTNISDGQHLVLSYAPNSSGTADITVRATDIGGLFVATSFTVRVNALPTFTSAQVLIAHPGIVYTYNITTADADSGDTLTITAPVKPAWLTLTDNGNGTATLSGSPSNIHLGNNNVTLQVSDGKAITQQIFAIKVSGLMTITLTSAGAYDGWILESSEASGKGGRWNKTDQTLLVGDDGSDRQYLSILSFDTSSLPAGAVINSVQLKVKYASRVGALPFTTHEGLYVDVKSPGFGAPALSYTDFQATATKLLEAKFNSILVGGWYAADVNGTDISKAQITQFRLRFFKDDNDDRNSDYIKFYSGNASPLNRPQLIISYYISVP